jgi:hypothetical protein
MRFQSAKIRGDPVDSLWNLVFLPLLHLAVDPADKNRMFVASHQGDVLASTDGGAIGSNSADDVIDGGTRHRRRASSR